MAYLNLNPERIEETIDQLARRIDERFSGASLGNVCRQLHATASQAARRAAWISRPHYSLRIGIGVLIAAILTGSFGALVALKPPEGDVDSLQFVQIFEAAINDLVLIGAAIFFLMTLETRIKRRRALVALHELRSIAHIIDMHQLTKDPERILSPGHETASSPRQALTPFQLSRYLDYCTEMLSLTGKIAALYVQNFDDSVALESASDLEALVTGLSRKIWQKIIIVDSHLVPHLSQCTADGDGSQTTGPQTEPVKG